MSVTASDIRAAATTLQDQVIRTPTRRMVTKKVPKQVERTVMTYSVKVPEHEVETVTLNAVETEHTRTVIEEQPVVTTVQVRREEPYTTTRMVATPTKTKQATFPPTPTERPSAADVKLFKSVQSEVEALAKGRSFTVFEPELFRKQAITSPGGYTYMVKYRVDQASAADGGAGSHIHVTIYKPCDGQDLPVGVLKVELDKDAQSPL